MCPHCAHRWRNPEARPKTCYASQTARNALPTRWLERKFAGRVADIAPLLADGMRLLEIGCAEGELGQRLKRTHQIHYCGVELSRDVDTARAVLDQVHLGTAAALEAEPFDAVLAFHVLEHIDELADELTAWRKLLAPQAWLLIEVPMQAGHPDLDWDHNLEHLHQFSPASLSALLTRCGFEPEWLTRGHFESPAYPDSLRVLSRQVRGPLCRREALLARFRRHLPGPFLVRGTGGDFRSFLAPLADALPIAGRLGEGEGERPYDAATDAGRPILACSLRFEDAIVSDLLALGHSPERLVRLSEILGDAA